MALALPVLFNPRQPGIALAEPVAHNLPIEDGHDTRLNRLVGAFRAMHIGRRKQRGPEPSLHLKRLPVAVTREIQPI